MLQNDIISLSVNIVWEWGRLPSDGDSKTFSDLEEKEEFKPDLQFWVNEFCVVKF